MNVTVVRIMYIFIFIRSPLKYIFIYYILCFNLQVCGFWQNIELTDFSINVLNDSIFEFEY